MAEYLEGKGWYYSYPEKELDCFEPGKAYFFTKAKNTYEWTQERDPRVYV